MQLVKVRCHLSKAGFNLILCPYKKIPYKGEYTHREMSLVKTDTGTTPVM